jgi:hypothetical protein
MIEKNSGKKATIMQTTIKPNDEPKITTIVKKDEDQVELDSDDEEDNYEDDQEDQDDQEPNGLGSSPT